MFAKCFMKCCGFVLFASFISVLLVLFPILSVLPASIDELTACHNSDLNKSTKTLPLLLGTFMSPISCNCASILGWDVPRNVHLTCLSSYLTPSNHKTLPYTIFV